MRPSDRRAAILDFARHTGELRVDEIAERFGVSRETIRRDLADLDARHLLKRVHGGAAKPGAAREAAFDQRESENAEAKRRIARAAAALFDDGDTLMLDAGSTTEAFAEQLASRRSVTVITNSTGVARRLGGQAARLYLVGGEYRGGSGRTVGSVAIDQIARFRADHAVLTVGGVDAAGGFMDVDVEEAMVARAMIAQVRTVTVVADHSKFGRIAMFKVCDLQAVARLVTDREPPSPLADALRVGGVEVVVGGRDAAPTED